MSNPNSSALISEKAGKWLGIPLALAFTALGGWWAYHEMHKALKYAGYLGIDFYAFMCVAMFWCSLSFLGGVTIREFLRNLFWFWGVGQMALAVRRNGLTGVGTLRSSDTQQHKHFVRTHAFLDKPLPLVRHTWSAILVGLLVSSAMLTGELIWGLYAAVRMGFAAVGFVIGVWTLCDAIFYLSRRTWRDGVTGGELFATIFGGPFAILGQAITYAVRLVRRRRAGLTQPQAAPVAA